MKAYRITIVDWDLEIICAAKTPGKAKYHITLVAYDAGWDVPFVRFRAVRAPEFDSLAQKAKQTKSLGWQDKEFSCGCLKPRSI